jgi:hypothetical protein
VILPPLSKKQVRASLDFLMEQMIEASKWVDKQEKMALEIPDPWEHFLEPKGSGGGCAGSSKDIDPCGDVGILISVFNAMRKKRRRRSKGKGKRGHRR